VISPLPALLPLVAGLLVLLVVGWGLGLAAALARRALGPAGQSGAGGPAPALLGLAVLVATGALVGYAVVLHAVGLIPL
jgi:hypothetical protein